ncbi:hypothetical protein KA005_83815 [bacterium]|nr:hypothetical protein [bacterium]
MNTYDRERAIKHVQSLQSLLDETANVINQYSIYPEEGSQASGELKTFPRTESVHTALSQGTSLIEVAADHIMALVKTTTEPVQAMAPWVCLRSILESAALATWLLDPNLDARTRVQRSLALRYKGFSQQTKIARTLNDNSYLNLIEIRIEEVEQVAFDLGFKRVTSKNNNRIGIGQIMPPLTDIVRDTLNEEATYRYLSALTHAHHWALQQVSFQKVDEQDAGISLMPNTKIMEKAMKSSSIAFLCVTAAIVISKPIWYKSRFFGWNLDQIESILDKQFDVMTINPSMRIWKQPQ